MWDSLLGIFAEALLICHCLDLIPQVIRLEVVYVFIDKSNQDHDVVDGTLKDPLIIFNMLHDSFHKFAIPDFT